MLSVFITPWMNPTSIQRATSDGLGLDDGLVEGEVRVLGVGRVRVVAGDGVVGEAGQQRRVAVLGGVLERADAQVAAGDPGQHGAGQRRPRGRSARRSPRRRGPGSSGCRARASPRR